MATLRYTTTAIVLHWLIALLIFAAFPLGLYMHGLKLSPAKLQLYSYHKWIGVTVLLLTVMRILWRITHTPPPLTLPLLQKIASQIMHQLLYVFILIIPLSGWLMSSAKGITTVWFGIVPLPNLVEKNKTLGHLLAVAHETLNYMLLALVILHVAAVLKHRYFDRNDVLARMLPGSR